MKAKSFRVKRGIFTHLRTHGLIEDSNGELFVVRSAYKFRRFHYKLMPGYQFELNFDA